MLKSVNWWAVGGMVAAGLVGYLIYDTYKQHQIAKAIVAAKKQQIKGAEFGLRHSLKDTSSDWTHTPSKEFLGMQNEHQSLVNTFSNSISIYDDVW